MVERVPARAAEVVDILPDGCMDLLWTGAALLVAGPDTAPHPYRPPERAHRGRPPVRARAAAGAARGAGGGAARPAGARWTSCIRARPRRPSRDWSSALPRPRCCSSWPLGLPGSRPEHGVPAVDRGTLRRGRSAAETADALGWTTRSLHRHCLAWFGYGPVGAPAGPALPQRRCAAARRGAAGRGRRPDRLRRPAAPVPRGAGAGRPRPPPAGHRPGSATRGPAQPGCAAKRSTPVPSGSCTTA